MFVYRNAERIQGQRNFGNLLQTPYYFVCWIRRAAHQAKYYLHFSQKIILTKRLCMSSSISSNKRSVSGNLCVRQLTCVSGK